MVVSPKIILEMVEAKRVKKANIIAVTGPQTSNKCVKHQLESS